MHIKKRHIFGIESRQPSKGITAWLRKSAREATAQFDIEVKADTVRSLI